MAERATTPGPRRLLPIAAVGGVAIVAVAVATVVVSLPRTGRTGDSTGAAPPAAGWSSLPDPPLAAREGAAIAWTGTEVIVVGGSSARPCPPNADCAAPLEPLRDGAAFDVATRSWRPIAPSPIPIVGASTAVVGGSVHVWFAPDDAPEFLAYDPAADEWRRLPLPDAPALTSVRIAAADGAVVAYRTTHELGGGPDLVFDVASGTWSELPPDPLGPTFDRSVVAAERGLVAIGVELVPDPGVLPPFYRAAILDPATREWRRLPDPAIVGYDPTWYAVGDLVVNPAPGSSDGGSVNAWGRSFRHGGILDVRDGASVELPGRDQFGPLQGVAGATDSFIVNSQGWVLDLASLRWAELDALPGGPGGGAASIGAGDRLFIFGGNRFEGDVAKLVDGAWEWGAPTE